MLDFAAPQIAAVDSGRKKFKTAAKNVGRQTSRKQLGSGSRRKTASRSIPTKSAKQTSRSQKKILTNNFDDHVEQFLVPKICGRFWKSWGKFPVVADVLSSHEQGIYPPTSLDENCIKFELQIDCNYYVDLRQTYPALKLKFVGGLAHETYNTKEKNRAQRRSKSG